ncbi:MULTISPECIES: ribonuclease D [Okeania]|uniref:Ribonuclease D n=1 Tax=Okeania hirsuta TaxID=1458930 RepID=A0A3N6NR94_9CYAN|nr:MULTISPECIES: ribonuclease D [Okeania]NET74787.1 ribonuclease D [Okeania sp. SIO1F9]RQH17966.1 ribonuclease D [Okeania hirsuta]RQH18524.1 ribonuclease D [Okeania hirsuta]
MFYLTDNNDLKKCIEQLATANILWIDTEVADYNTRRPRLSLIQILADSQDLVGGLVYILDVLDNPDLTNFFIDKIMVEPNIEKVFHNARFDIKFLGKNEAKNITCTWEIAKKLPYYILPVPNFKLKTLVENLTDFKNIDKEIQGSDWGQRPLTEKQLEYAKMDSVYLAQVHLALFELMKQNNSEPTAENLDELSQRYQDILHEWKLLDSEIAHILERIKLAMQVQNISETSTFKLSATERVTQKVNFAELAAIVQDREIDLDFPITVTQKLQKDFGDIINEISVNKEKTSSWKLTVKNLSDIN